MQLIYDKCCSLSSKWSVKLKKSVVILFHLGLRKGKVWSEICVVYRGDAMQKKDGSLVVFSEVLPRLTNSSFCAAFLSIRNHHC